MHRIFSELKANNWLRDMAAQQFAKEAAHFLAELNAIHPFRDGNGRAQFTFVSLLAFEADHSIEFDRIDPDQFLAAMIESFYGRERPLAEALFGLIEKGM